MDKITQKVNDPLGKKGMTGLVSVNPGYENESKGVLRHNGHGNSCLMPERHVYDADQVEGKWVDVTKSGFYVSDCVDFMKAMPEECVDLVVTSPPYDNLRDYRGYNFQFEEVAKGLLKVLKTGGIVIWVIGDKINGGRTLTSFRQGLYFQEAGFLMHDIMIYQKKNTPFMRSNAYTNCFEFMFVLSKGKPKTFNPLREKTVRNGFEMLVHNKKSDGVNKKILKELKPEKVKNNIWSYAVGLGGTTSDKIAFTHPALFPENLAMDHILSWSNEGDLVFDPMCGAGTTCKMAALTKRRYIGTDISDEYIKVARQRLGKVL